MHGRPKKILVNWSQPFIAKTAGKPKAGESARMKRKRASFKARHRRNIAHGKMSAAYWANKVKW